MPAPLLNLDGGELEDEPEELYALADVVSIACGGHAGDAASMTRVARACAKFGTQIGAHPSYPDREGFGRRRVALALPALAESVAEQCAGLRAIVSGLGARVTSAKPHGALYHAANADPELARACIASIESALGTVAVIGPPHGELSLAASARGLPYLREGFADRRTREDGTLVDRKEPGAIIEDPEVAARNASELMRSGNFETVCVHGDTRGALAVVSAVRRALGPRPT